VSAAICDLSPVGDALPDDFDQALRQRQRPPFSQVRELPPWGSIFSPHVLFVRPTSAEEEAWFVQEVEQLLTLLAEQLPRRAAHSWQEGGTVSRWAGQLNYCKRQKQNDKTRRVLEKAFSPAWADRYIEQVLFDDPPPPPAAG
jgi:phycocyanobilin:ferredoxin oxidoreductase